MPRFTIEKKQTTKGKPKQYITTVKRLFPFFLYPRFAITTTSNKETTPQLLLAAHDRALKQLAKEFKINRVPSHQLKDARTYYSIVETAK